MNLSNKPILFFDGACHLCQWSVQFILRHERNPDLLFATLQGETARSLLSPAQLITIETGVLDAKTKSVVFYQNGEIQLESEAMLSVIAHLRYPWKLAFVGRAIPRKIRDGLYHWVARNREQWFGSSRTCEVIQNPKTMHRFLK